MRWRQTNWVTCRVDADGRIVKKGRPHQCNEDADRFGSVEGMECYNIRS